MPYTDLFGTDCLSMGGIKTLKLATRDTADLPLDFPLDFQLKTNDESIIVLMDDEDNRTITMGTTEILYRKVMPLHSNFVEEEVTDRQGRFYNFTLSFQLPQLSLTTNNQLKNFLFTSSGEFAISSAVAFIEDLNGKLWILGYDIPLTLETFELTTGAEGEDNMYTLTYVGKSYNRIRQYEVGYNFPYNGLTSYWKFDEIVNTNEIVNQVVPSTPLTIDITYDSLVTGIINNSLKAGYINAIKTNTNIIYGVNDYITINYWTNLSYYSSNNTIPFSTCDTGRTSGMTIIVNPVINTIYFAEYGSFGQIGKVLPEINTTDVWQMHTWVDKGTSYEFYINGVLKWNPTGLSAVRKASNVTGIISAWRYSGGQYVRRTWVDEMGLWKRQLTQTEITTLYNNGKGFSY